MKGKILLFSAILIIAGSARSQAQEVKQWEPARKTVKEFLKMADNDTTTCRLSGLVTKVQSYGRGKLYLQDATGNVYIYGVVDVKDGRSFYDVDVREGDSLVVTGRRNVYNGIIEMSNAAYISHVQGPDHYSISKKSHLDKEPSFKGKGLDEFSKWVSTHVEFPLAAKIAGAERKVTVRFIVGMDGSVIEPAIVKGSHPALDDEVLRVLRSAPKWKPGSREGYTVRVTYTMTVVL